jgi:ketosteroid isomerase-like protein
MTIDDIDRELVNINKKLINAWSTHDIETIYNIQKNSIGYGYRDKNLRPQPTPQDKQNTAKWFSTMKEYTILNVEENYRIDGDVGICWGGFTEKIVEHNDSIRYVNVRHSSTWKKEDGKWLLLFYHRDNIFN